MGIVVSELPLEQKPEWDEFVLHHSGALPFHLGSWRCVIQGCYGYPYWHLVARENGRIEGGLQLYKVSCPLVGSSISSPPGGICTHNPSAASLLLEKAKAISEGEGVGCLIIRDSRYRWGDEAEWRSNSSNSVCKLPTDIATLKKIISRSVMKNVRRGLSLGIDTRVGSSEFIDEFYNNLSELLHDKGVPVFSRRFLKLLTKELANQYVILSAHWNGQTIGSTLFLKLRDTLFAIWGGVPARYLHLDASNVLWWAGFQYAVENGFAYLDMGRSECGSGLEEYKRRWGCAAHPIYHYQFSEGKTPFLNPLVERGGGAGYKLFSKIWRWLPDPVIRGIGPMLRRCIPLG